MRRQLSWCEACSGPLSSWYLFLCLMVGSIWARAQAPLVIENLSDRATYDRTVWFRVPATDGYSYRVLLDGQPVATDLTNWVESVDYHELFVSRSSLTDGSVTNRMARFIVQSERGNPEKGLIRWTPYP